MKNLKHCTANRDNLRATLHFERKATYYLSLQYHIAVFYQKEPFVIINLLLIILP